MSNQPKRPEAMERDGMWATGLCYDLDEADAYMNWLEAALKVQTERAQATEQQAAEAHRQIGSQTATIKSLCDRLDKIHRIATRPGSMKARLAEIEGLSGGFMPVPAR